MGFAPDPGGVFESDTHRRVCGHAPDPGTERMTLNDLGLRIQPDLHHGLSHVDELSEVLEDLRAKGYVDWDDDGWITTDSGMAALAAPAPETSGPVTPAVIGGLTGSL